MSVLAYITDLFFQAKVGETAHQAGINLKIVTSLYKFFPELKPPPSLILIDLNAQGISPTAFISQLKNSNPEIPIVAFGKHVQKDLLNGAREAGADLVLAQSALSKHLPEILRGERPGQD